MTLIIPDPFFLLLCVTVNGGWTEWTLWTTCTKTCGSGSTMRNRTCTNPSTTYGGMDCKGTGDELILCNTNRCLGEFRVETKTLFFHHPIIHYIHIVFILNWVAFPIIF